MAKLRGKINERVSEEQFGFRKGKGATNALSALRIIIEGSIEMQSNVFMCFEDFEKALDTVKHEEMIKILNDIGVDEKDTRMISTLYWNQKAAVRVGDEKADWIEIKRGVR